MSTAVAHIADQKGDGRSVLVTMATRYGMEPRAFEATLRATVVPKDTSPEQFAAFLLVAREYSLNPILKEIYAFPTRGGGIQPIVSIDGWSNLVNSHPQCDGFDFEDHIDSAGALVSITCRMYRKDRKHPIVATEYMAECRRATDTWRQWPRRMLRHKALIQAARYAFGLSGIADPDEGARAHDPVLDVTPDAPRRVTGADLIAQAAAPPVTDAEIIEPPPAPVADDPPAEPKVIRAVPLGKDDAGNPDWSRWQATVLRGVMRAPDLATLTEWWKINGDHLVTFSELHPDKAEAMRETLDLRRTDLTPTGK